jgi:PAS domain S-box-containing protein
MLGFFTVGAAVEFSVGWFLLHAVDARWIEIKFALSAGTLTALGLLGAMAWLSGRALGRAASERDRLESAVRSANAKNLDSDRRFRRMLESLPQPAWIANAYGNLEWFNQGWKEYTGMGADSAQGRSRAWEWESVLEPAEARLSSAQWQKCVTSGVTFELECRLRRASDGAYRRHFVRAMPLRDAGGRIVQWLGTCTDIETQREAEPTRILEQVSHLVTAVTGGNEALATLRKNQHDLVRMSEHLARPTDTDELELTVQSGSKKRIDLEKT